MHRSLADRSVRSLAEVKRDEDVEIAHIAFDVIRERCPALGLGPGVVVHCVDARGWDLVLRTPAATEVVIDRFYAAFIEVRPLPAHARLRCGAHRARPQELAPAGSPSLDSETGT
jgi:hypothetical protein